MLKQSLLAGLAVAVFSSVASGAGYPLVRGQSPNGYGPMPQAYPPSQQYAGPMVPAPQYAPNGVRPVGYETYGSAQEPYGSYDSSGYCPPPTVEFAVASPANGIASPTKHPRISPTPAPIRCPRSSNIPTTPAKALIVSSTRARPIANSH